MALPRKKSIKYQRLDRSAPPVYRGCYDRPASPYDRPARPPPTVMPDLIGHLTIKQKRTQKRHLTWAEMPLKCFEIVTLYDNDKVTNLNDSRKNKPRKRKRERCNSPPGAGALLRHDVFQPVRVGGKALDAELAQLVPRAGLTSAQTNGVIPAGPHLPACSPVAEIRMPQECTGPRRRVTATVFLQLLKRVSTDYFTFLTNRTQSLISLSALTKPSPCKRGGLSRDSTSMTSSL